MREKDHDMSPERETVENEWETGSYDEEHSFVFEYGEDIVDLLDPQADERILDLGCGTGHLTDQIGERAGTVVGVDAAAEMIDQAREEYPDRDFVHADAREFTFEESFDAVFSNAALHWIPEQDAVLDSVADVLRPGGRFVAELGGTGNVQAIIDAVGAAAADRGYAVENPWYFPSVGKYATRLEAHGFEVQYTRLFDRPTELDGEDGLATWLEMFGDSLLAPVPDNEQEAVISATENELRDEYFDGGTWTAGYRRLRVVAVWDSR